MCGFKMKMNERNAVLLDMMEILNFYCRKSQNPRRRKSYENCTTFGLQLKEMKVLKILLAKRATTNFVI